MALISTFTCKECGEEKHEIVNSSGVCQNCRRTIASKQKKMYLSSLKGLTTEERLDRIEEMIYSLDTEKRLKYLENSFIQY